MFYLNHIVQKVYTLFRKVDVLKFSKGRRLKHKHFIEQKDAKVRAVISAAFLIEWQWSGGEIKEEIIKS